jgi:adenylylsulfate kinase-like enzyme
MADAGLIVIVALVSPFRSNCERPASLMPPGRFLKYSSMRLEICGQRDVKGLYRKQSLARSVTSPLWSIRHLYCARANWMLAPPPKVSSG